ncbi:hypothetical protein ACH5RR_010574 [Cinchona calisaya]|uniref:Uncharacterized protein n=1 Tax=Cinchona calisaya TaxID=153742 RepID=A0ABD3AJB6_9GENT
MRTLNVVLVFCMALVILVINIKPNEGSRILLGEEEQEEDWMKKQHLFLQSLQTRKTVNPPSPNPCTYVSSPPPPGQHCQVPSTIGERNFAGRVVMAPPPPPPPTAAYPQHMVQFGVATNRKLL